MTLQQWRVTYLVAAPVLMLYITRVLIIPSVLDDAKSIDRGFQCANSDNITPTFQIRSSGSVGVEPWRWQLQYRQWPKWAVNGLNMTGGSTGLVYLRCQPSENYPLFFGCNLSEIRVYITMPLLSFNESVSLWKRRTLWLR